MPIKETVRYYIEALLYGRSEKGYYMFEVSPPPKGTQKTNIRTFEKIKIPNITKLEKIRGFDPEKSYQLLQARQVNLQTIWRKVTSDRINNIYLFFYWDPAEEHKAIKYFWKYNIDSKEDIPMELNMPELKESLNKLFGDLSYDDIIDLFQNLTEDEVSNLHDALEPQHQAKLLTSFFI